MLARELEVSERTIHRDVDALGEAGVPIYAERGPHGGIQLVDGYRTRLTGLTGDEAEALFLSGVPGPAAELGLGTVVAAARLKVLASLPAELRTRASRLVERFHLDSTGWFHRAESVPLLGPLADAVWEGRRLRMAYRRDGRLIERDVGPLGLVLKAGTWYLVGMVGSDVRTYRAGRIASVSALEGPFERPAGFDLGTWWTESSAAYERDAPHVVATIRIEPAATHRLADFVGEAAMASAERLAVDDPSGWTHLRLSIEWADEAAGRLIGLGGALEILEPPELRERAAELARGALERHRPRAD